MKHYFRLGWLLAKRWIYKKVLDSIQPRHARVTAQIIELSAKVVIEVEKK